MKQYLIDFLKYNDWAFRELLISVRDLPEKDEAVKLLGHLITSHNKWYNRITKNMDDDSINWFGPEIPLDQLESKWLECFKKWVSLINDTNESALEKKIVFQRQSDGKSLGVKFRDIVLQLNYHSIHHRAQLNHLIALQGKTPPKTDYIFTVLKET